MTNPIKLGEPQDPTRAIVDPVNPPDQSIYQNPVSNMTLRRSPASQQVGSQPNGLFNKIV